ncbi:NAD(P)H-quinone oxidoreductase subunit 4 [Stenomitos frigidus ULC18]|uniref:NAD(P)H-quinone oxidoreductase chain 4 n=2 Tax=Stenomitos TaxID=1844270 RepID=A0A2T1EAI6_9CYAN|nr:NAD(P)H-quinone oxidoreductase subunit 4 [Stenomitos frigidus ULC18]
MMIEQFPWLTVIVLLPLVATLFIPLLPGKSGKTVRWYALGVGIADFGLMCYAFWRHYDASQTTFQLAEKVVWLPQLGLSWALSVDGISAPLVLLAGFVTTLSMFAAWQVDRRSRLFYALMLILYATQVGVFVAQDLMLFFIMWEVELVPVYLLVCIWGGQNRAYAATKFLMYTALASIFILVAALGLGLYGDTLTFDMAELGRKQFPLGLELFLYAGLLVAFGVKLAIFPFHTWLADTHGEASSPVSMILAGVLLKMGGYGLIRLNLELLPHAHVYFAPVLAILGVVNIVYGALNSFTQTNMKRRLAYSSISHMGFVLLGIASYSDLGVSGAMLQMLSHGLIASVLFFLAGVTYDRTRTMMMNQLGGMGQAMPTVFALFTMGAMASLALPGMSGFVGELEVFVGLATTDIYGLAFRLVTIFLAAVGLILTPIYLLSMVRQVFHGASADQRCDLVPACDLSDLDLKAQGNQEANCFGTDCILPEEAEFKDANSREIFIAVCFLGLIIAIGCYPKVATQMYDVKTMAVNAQVRAAYHEAFPDGLQRSAQGLWSPAISAVPSADVWGVVK